MPSLAQHIANLRAFKAVFQPNLETTEVVEGSIEHFFTDEFKAEAGGFLYKHLEELAALVPDQAELKRLTDEKSAGITALMPQLKDTHAKYEKLTGNLKKENSDLSVLITLLEAALKD